MPLADDYSTAETVLADRHVDLLADFPEVDDRFKILLERLDAKRVAAEGNRVGKDRTREARSAAKGDKDGAIEKARSQGHELPPKEAAKFDAAIERATRADEAQAITTKQGVQAMNAALAVVETAKRALRNPDGIQLANFKAELPSKPGELPAYVEKQRADIAALTADIESAQEALPPMESVFAKLRGEIALLKAKALPRVSLDPKGNPTLNWLMDWAVSPMDGATRVAVIDPRVAMAYLADDAILADVRTQLERKYAAQTVAPMSATEKAKAVTQLRAQKLRAERREVSAIWAAHAVGIVIEFRPDVDGRALLGLV